MAMNVTARNNASAATMWDNSQVISVHKWTLVSLGNITRAEDLVEHLAIDFPCLHNPNDLAKGIIFQTPKAKHFFILLL